LRNQEYSGVSLPVVGDTNTTIVVLFTRENVLKLVDALNNQKSGKTRFVGEYNQSIIKEVGNIICNSYLNALNQTFKLSLIGLLPELIFNISNSVVDLLDKDLKANQSDRRDPAASRRGIPHSVTTPQIGSQHTMERSIRSMCPLLRCATIGSCGVSDPIWE